MENKPHKLAVSILLIALNLIAIHLVKNIIQYSLISNTGANIFSIIGTGLFEAAIGMQIFFFNPIFLIFRLLLIPIARVILSANKLLVGLVGILLILCIIYLIGYPVLRFLAQQNNLGYGYYSMYFFAFPALSLFSIIWISFTGYNTTSDLIRKLIIPSILLFFVITPGITITSNLKEVTLKQSLGLLHRPKYLPTGMGAVSGERTVPPNVEWMYYCSASPDGLTTYGSLTITQSKLGEKDFPSGTVGLESKLNYYKQSVESPYRTDKPILEPTNISGNPGYFYYSKSQDGGTDIVLFWSTSTNLVEIRANCNNLNKSEMLRIAESMSK